MEEGNIRVRYSDKELEEFKALIEEKIKKAQTDLELIKSSYMNSATNGTDDTSPTFKAFEEGSKVIPHWLFVKKSLYATSRMHLSVSKTKPMASVV